MQPSIPEIQVPQFLKADTITFFTERGMKCGECLAHGQKHASFSAALFLPPSLCSFP